MSLLLGGCTAGQSWEGPWAARLTLQLTSSFLAFSTAGLGTATCSSELLAVWPAGSEAVVSMVSTGAGLCTDPQAARGRLPCKMNWTMGWLTGA